jgi:hypothetical protein
MPSAVKRDLVRVARCRQSAAPKRAASLVACLRHARFPLCAPMNAALRSVMQPSGSEIAASTAVPSCVAGGVHCSACHGRTRSVRRHRRNRGPSDHRFSVSDRSNGKGRLTVRAQTVQDREPSGTPDGGEWRVGSDELRSGARHSPSQSKQRLQSEANCMNASSLTSRPSTPLRDCPTHGGPIQ